MIYAFRLVVCASARINTMRMGSIRYRGKLSRWEMAGTRNMKRSARVSNSKYPMVRLMVSCDECIWC